MDVADAHLNAFNQLAKYKEYQQGNNLEEDK
jgi:hypothetical protein